MNSIPGIVRQCSLLLICRLVNNGRYLKFCSDCSVHVGSVGCVPYVDVKQLCLIFSLVLVVVVVAGSRADCSGAWAYAGFPLCSVH